MQFRLLGPMQLLVAGRPIAPPGAAERALLALLLVSSGRVVSTSALIDRLWSEDALPADPVNALQLRVSKLRRALSAHGADVISREAVGYRADVPSESVDLHRFVDLVASARRAAKDGATPDRVVAAYDEALELWHGEPLVDFTGEPWAMVEVARLEEMHRSALTDRAHAALAAGRHAEVAAELEPVVAADPKQEALCGLLMTALYRSGRQAEALDAYDRTRQWLDDELGLDPSAALRSLHQKVLEQDVELAAIPAIPAIPAETGSAAPASATPTSHLSAPGPAGSLPAGRMRLIGRDEQLDAVARTLTESRVVTLVGPGGAGKTSLAIAVAQRAAAQYRDGAHLVRLATVTRPADVPLAVAEALGVPLDGADPNVQIRARVVGFLASKQLLLVVDNCEHVIDAAAGLLEAVSSGADGTTLLVTSREALAIPGEVQLNVAPLAAPPPGTPAERVLDYPAPALLIERARAVRAELHLDEQELRALAQVCVQLDGMPLALELAAARLSSLSLSELAERLSDRFGLLTTGARTAETRQRTLRATVEWSHALLPPVERAVFRRLAVFHGGWTLDAAEAVTAGDEVSTADVLDVLSHLVNRSMVVRESGHPTRYRMLETLRQFAAEQLERAGEQAAVAERHAAYFRTVADRAEEGLRGHGQRATLKLLRDEHPNLRAALSWLSSDESRVEDGLHLAGALALFWHLGRHVEGREVLARLVALPGGSVHARARALQAVSIVERPRACLVHPSARCGETAQQSLDLFTAEGDLHRAALSQVLLAVELLDGSDPARFTSLLEEAEHRFIAEDDAWGLAVISFVRLQNYLRRGDEPRARATGRTATEAFRRLDDGWGLSAVLYHLGWGLKEFGRYAEAVPVLEQAIDVSSSVGVFNTAQWALGDLGVTFLHLGDRDAAVRCFDRAAAASEEVGDAAGEVLAALGRGLLAVSQRDSEAARPLFEDALAGFQRVRTPLWAGQALAGLAWCDWMEGDLDSARGRSEEVRDSGSTLGEQVLVAAGLEGLARVATSHGDREQALDLIREAGKIRAEAARPLPPYERAGLVELLGDDALSAGP